MVLDIFVVVLIARYQSIKPCGGIPLTMVIKRGADYINSHPSGIARKDVGVLET